MTASQHLAEIEYEREERRERKKKRKKKVQIAKRIERQLKELELLATDLEDQESNPPISTNDWIKLLGQIAVVCKISREAWCVYATRHPHVADTIYLRLYSSATALLGNLQQQNIQLPDAAIEIVRAIENATTYQSIQQMKDAAQREEDNAAQAKVLKQLEAAERERAALNNPHGCPNCGSGIFTDLGRSGPPKWIKQRSCYSCSTRYAPPQITVEIAASSGLYAILSLFFSRCSFALLEESWLISIFFFAFGLFLAVAAIRGIAQVPHARSIRL